MEFFKELLEEIQLIELPTIAFLLKQSYMIMGVTLIFALHFEFVDYTFKIIAGSSFVQYLLLNHLR